MPLRVTDQAVEFLRKPLAIVKNPSKLLGNIETNGAEMIPRAEQVLALKNDRCIKGRHRRIIQSARKVLDRGLRQRRQIVSNEGNRKVGGKKALSSANTSNRTVAIRLG
ncbi:MAG: hypothetical protein Ct9H300mP8_13450 [Gammaproteobacteria bacterium]|nr:MAG: hypothetical protein Ct9H300mP8_13450 [Gammaproteobacteria bacterium]